MAHIKDCVDVTVDPHQYAYRKNRSTEDAISSVVHTALTHLENKDSYVRLLFVDFTSAFNTIIPQTLVQKLTTLGLSSTLCNWVLDFLTDRPQSVKDPRRLLLLHQPQHRLPPGLCAEPPPVHPAHTRLLSDTPELLSDRREDDTAVVGRITNNDESDYRQEVEHLEGWCRQNNLCIKVKKTKEMIVDFRRGRHLPSPLYIGGTAVEVVSSFRHISVPLLPQEAEARRAGELSPDLLLQMCGGERPVLLHHRVARQLLGGREEGSAEGGEGCTEDFGKGWTAYSGSGVEFLPQVEFKYLGVLFTSEGKMEREMDRRIGAASAVLRTLIRSVVVKRELSQKAKLSIYWSIYVPTLTYGHESSGLRDRVRSSDIHLREAQSRAAAPPRREEPIEVVWASLKDASWTPPCGGVSGMSIWEETPGQ
ncbi:hypothetical protein L3Q82_006342 [Scortum barcoo]|uniref:Uncharacterized protein n=1 Tax=Scortum barcoo TaxID=214431 RepID=A0ACB8X298_9TELE|nr:hypothetical protein L3Q82_006342 [Scortum barcoo]